MEDEGEIRPRGRGMEEEGGEPKEEEKAQRR